MENRNRFLLWLKRYGTYTLAGVLILAMATMVLLSGLNSPSDNVEVSSAENPVVSVNTLPITFSMPMENATLIKDFSSSGLYFSSTLGWWEYHDGIDLTSTDLKVYAVADGYVSAINTNSLIGTTVTITHSNKLKSVYGSLNNELNVSVGDTVNEGDQIGTADDTASNEEADGNHLHFEMLENDKKIDPANYLEFEVK